jgi:hypothetical protein
MAWIGGPKMMDLRQWNAKHIVMIVLLVFFLVTWAILFRNNINLLARINQDATGFGPIDIARRVTSPSGRRTAILARSYAAFIDLNFALYITDDALADITSSSEDASFISDSERADRTDSPLWLQRALWISHDYEPTTHRNWHEDVVWSEDGTVVAVTIEEQFVFAYDFQTGQQYEDPAQIQGLLE